MQGAANTADYVPSRPKILQTFKREYEPPGSRANHEQQSASSTKHKKTDEASTKKRDTQSGKKKAGGAAAKVSKNDKAPAETSHIQTQTDWSWIQDMQIMEKIRRGNSISPTTSCGEISFCSCLKELNGFCFRLQQFRGR